MSRDIVRISPHDIKARISRDLLRDQVTFDEERQPLSDIDKHRSIALHYVDRIPWEETPLFTNIYASRFASGETEIRGCRSIATLVTQYERRVDAMFRDMRAHGYGDDFDPIPVCVDRAGTILLGNQGNHRLAMAQVLNLPYVIAVVTAQHPDCRRTFEPIADRDPELPESAKAIPAMTTDAERRCYYRLTREQAWRGTVVELGSWLGASSAYIAAGIRDAGVSTRAQIYDRFVWKPASHDKKAGGPIGMSQLDAFRKYLGPLLQHVDVHKGEVSRLEWSGGPVSLLVCDAPKRTPEISAALTTFAGAMQPGSLMAWQDFAYFPSYDIPAALMRLGKHVEFVEAVYPGTTAVFRVRKPWTASTVSEQALSLKRWKADEIEAAWDAWTERLPALMQPRFACGAAMFLCHIGEHPRARRRLESILAEHSDAVLPKWRYLLEERANLMQRYRPLVEVIQRCA